MSERKAETNALTPKTQEERQSWISLAFVQAGICVCLPSFLEGALLAEAMPFWQAIAAGIAGNVIVVILMSILGFIGSDLGRASCTLTESTFGKKGARYIISVIYAVNLIGWFGINNEECGMAFSNFMQSAFGIGIPHQVSSIGWGIIMLITAVFGMNAIEKLNYISIPLLGIKATYTVTVFVALAMIVIMFCYLRYTKHGYEIAVVGESQRTARYAGINVGRVMMRTMVISGVLCGVTGFLIVGGQDQTISITTAGGNGFTAIIVAWMAKFNAFYMALIAALLTFLDKGAAQIASSYANLNEYASDIIAGIILFFLIGCEFFINYRLVFRGGHREVK